MALAYVLTAHVGFQFAFAAEQITTVWAPTGIGIAALLLWGPSLWPAIWIGAFGANAFSTAPLWTAVLVASGNTLEAIAAAWALRRFGGFDDALHRLRDVIAFIVIAAGLSTMVSATIGVATLSAAGVQPWNRFCELWGDWWLGDAVGALIVTPVILTTLGRGRASRQRWAEASLLVAGSVIATAIVFGQALGPTVAHHPLEYVIFPFVIAAAVRYGQPTTACVVLAASAVTIWNTVRGAGPFATATAHESLILLQVFMGVLAGTGLVLAAAIAERETGERRRAAAHAVGEVLAEAPDLPAAAPVILRVICGHLGWQFGALWLVEPRGRYLKCSAQWSDSAVTPAFASASMDIEFASGVGLPGRIWQSGTAAWIDDVLEDSNFPRAAAARQSRLRGGFGFPICLGGEVLGVIECLHTMVVPSDSDLLRTMSTVGNQIGQFMGRKREESAVREEQRRTSSILNSALDAIIGMDHQGIITEFNPGAVTTFGYSREGAVGRQVADLLIPPSLRDRHREGLERYLSTGSGQFIDRRVETTGYGADGREFPIEIAIVRVSDDEPPRFTGFVRDLTARQQAEHEREQALGREAAARREAEAANRAKDEFLATLSHELRTPLNAIVGWTRMLLDGSLDPASRRRALEVIDRNAQLQVQLVADILDVSRIITGGLRLDLCPLDLAGPIGAALDAVRPAADAKKVQLRSRLQASGAVIQGDAQRLQQIVWNLLANSVKFTGSGGTVTVDLLDAGASLVIRVDDDGAGIDPEFLPFVFDRFRQADGSVSREHGGLGLGLAIVRHLVELHGGTVRAESRGQDRGATFTVQFPKLEVPALTPSPAPPGNGTDVARPPADELRGLRVLVVDDEEDARELTAAMLREAGADVQTAASAAEALRHLDRSRPDALLADIGMPGADGYALIRQIRQRDVDEGRYLPAAAITAYAGDRDRDRALAAGYDVHVPKPVNRGAVVAAVRAICPERDLPR